MVFDIFVLPPNRLVGRLFLPRSTAKRYDLLTALSWRRLKRVDFPALGGPKMETVNRFWFLQNAVDWRFRSDDDRIVVTVDLLFFLAMLK
jgi:hypothetical protein